jgi:peptide subunit release factor 1 (eRF1)
MHKRIELHDGVIRPQLVAELEASRPTAGRVSSYYLDLNPGPRSDLEAARIAVKNALAEDRQRIEQLDLPHDVRMTLRQDWELVSELAPRAVGDRHTLGVACFVGSGVPHYARAVRLPWPVRHRAFFEDHFVLWPLRQVLDQADRYAVVITDKEHARFFLYFLAQCEEVAKVLDWVPGKIHVGDPSGEWHYRNKHVEYFHRHFERVSEAALRQFEREPFDHLIVGGRVETLPQFEGRLHRYLRDRVVARWEIDVNAPTAQVAERAREEERQYLQRQAEAGWKAIQNQRLARGTVGPEEVFAALWARQVQTMLVEPGVTRSGFSCVTCGRLSIRGGPCAGCGNPVAGVADVFEEAVHEAIEQSAQVRYWKDPALTAAGSLAAFKRF